MAALGRQRLPQSYRRAEHERPSVRRGLGAARAALEMAVLAAAKADGKPVELLEMGVE